MPPAVLTPRSAATLSDASFNGAGVHDFANLPTARPEAPDPNDIRRYNFGVEAQTIPLNAIQRDGKIRPERFIGRQKDTEHETIYYLSGADYDRVYQAYHKNTPAEHGVAPTINDSFFAKDRHVSIIRLPNRPQNKSVIGADGGVYLSPEEKRYLDGLAAHAHSHARGHGEYKAYYEFYRRTDPNIRATGEAALLTPQDINNKVAVHLLELRRTEKLSEHEFDQILGDMKQAVGEDGVLTSLLYAADHEADQAEINRVEGLISSEDSANVSNNTVRGPSRKAAERRRTAANEERVEQAKEVRFDNASVETQKARITPLLELESVRQEIIDNSPIPLLSSSLMLDRRQKKYVQLSATEHDRQFTLADGRVITGTLEVRYHTRTQERDPELPGYRATLRHAGRSYELTDISVIKAGQRPPDGEVNYVVVGKNGPVMYLDGQRCSGWRTPDMLVTADGKVFTRQGVARSASGQDYRVVSNASGVRIREEDSTYLKGKWHIPFIPTATDLAGHD